MTKQDIPEQADSGQVVTVSFDDGSRFEVVGTAVNECPQDRRALAAISACQYIPTEALEAGVVADMLEALQELIDLNENHGPFGGEMYQDRIDRAWTRARAAYAKATGETK